MTAKLPKTSDTLGVGGDASCVFLYPDGHPAIVYALSLSRLFGERILGIRAFFVEDILGVGITWADGTVEMFAYPREAGDFAVGWFQEPTVDDASLFSMALDLYQEWSFPRPRHILETWLGY